MCRSIRKLTRSGDSENFHEISKLKVPCPLSPRFKLPPPEVEFEVHHMKTPLLLGCCVAWEKNGCLIRFAIGGDGNLEFPWFKFATAASEMYSLDVIHVTQLCPTAFTGAELELEMTACREYSFLTISFNSGNIGDTRRDKQLRAQYPSWDPEHSAIVRLSAIVTMGSSTRFGGTLLLMIVVDVDDELETSAQALK
ncbi:hypothetical protein Tco_0320767 [Tanacetum coccineum]